MSMEWQFEADAEMVSGLSGRTVREAEEDHLNTPIST